jgi:hypothetical protein
LRLKNKNCSCISRSSFFLFEKFHHAQYITPVAVAAAPLLIILAPSAFFDNELNHEFSVLEFPGNANLQALSHDFYEPLYVCCV